MRNCVNSLPLPVHLGVLSLPTRVWIEFVVKNVSLGGILSNIHVAASVSMITISFCNGLRFMGIITGSGGL